MQNAERVRIALERLALTREKVNLAVETAVAVAQPSRVILFGSWPRGEARWDSDLDLAVLLPDSSEAELSSIHRRLRRNLDRIPITVDLVVATEGFAKNFQTSINSVYYRILNEGKVVYERQPVLANADPAHQSG
jgi:uncharacterized protein